jgi:hypothetical protein
VFDVERILIAELDLKAMDKECITLDVSDHYQRADLFDLIVRRSQMMNFIFLVTHLNDRIERSLNAQCRNRESEGFPTYFP